MSPAYLSSCVHRPGCPDQRSLDHLARCAFEDASRTCSVRYHRAPPSGFSKDPPLYRHHSRCPLPAKFRLPLSSPSAGRCQATRSFRPRGLSPPRRLSPPTARGLVASHSRPWGSSGFNLVPHHRNGAPHAVSPPMPYPSELSPPAKPYLHLCRPLPSCRFELRSWGHQGSSTSRPCSVRASVVAASRCRSTTPVALLGFPVSGASLSSSHHADRRPRSSTALPSPPSRRERERPPPGITGVRHRPKATPREADARDCGGVGLPASPQPANRSGAGPRSAR